MKKNITFICIFLITTILSFSNTLKIAQEADPRTFDPHMGNDGFSLRINRLLYSRLLEKDSNMNTVPGLAKEYEVLDNQNILFTLNSNIYFQNGDLLTSKDVKYSFDRMKESPRIAGILPPIKEIDIIDSHKFIMRLEKPFSPILDQLTHPALSIISEKDGNLLGTGKYTLKNWVPGEKIILERYENYFSDKPNYKEIYIKIIPLATNRTIALETGEVDLAFTLPVQDKKIIDDNPNLTFLQRPSISYTYMGLNLKKEIFKDIEIRKAIDLAIDKNSIIESVLDNAGSIANSPIAKEIKGYNNNLQNNTYNKNKARKILENKSLNLKLATLSNNTDVSVSEIIQSNLKDAGVNVEIVILEPNIYWTKTNAGEYDMFIGSWGSATGDADYALYPTHHSTTFGAAGNRTFFENERVDLLLEKARETIDSKEKDEIYKEIQEIIVNNYGEIMLFYRDLNGAHNNKIKNFMLYPVPIHDYSLGSVN